MTPGIDFQGGEPLNVGVETPTDNCPNCPIGKLVITDAPTEVNKEGYVTWECESRAGGCGFRVRAPRYTNVIHEPFPGLMGRPF